MRVYAVDPDVTRGELSGAGRRLVTHQGDELWPVQRVVFDDDTDAGMATVTVLVPTFDRSQKSPGFPGELAGFVLDPELNKPAVATFRAWVRALPSGAVPKRDREAILTKSEDGRVICLPGEFFEPKFVEMK